MKRLNLFVMLVALLSATAAYAGGKGCDISKTAAKSVDLTGTIATAGSGDGAKTVFRVANSDRSYTICHKTKADVLRLSNDGNAYRVTGKLVSCGEGQELVIENAKKV